MQRITFAALSLLLLGSGANVSAQTEAPTLELQSVGFNSSFELSQSQISDAQISDLVASNINNIIRFERSQMANGGPAEDDFYNLPPLTNTTGPLSPGTVLKIQDFTNTTSFVIPPNTALSRIIYTTTNLNGTVIPASAFILWPFQPRQFPSSSHSSYSTNNGSVKAPVVLWSHGTSAIFTTPAPSSDRQLWYGDSAPFTLALAGYAVVAPDYAGIGISESWDGSYIPHQYLSSLTSAHDCIYAMQAALEAFPDRLTEEYVAMGHSQGGGVAWGVAETVANEPSLSKGYLGTIAGSPTTRLFSGIPDIILPWVSVPMPYIFPDFKITDFLTDLGVSRLDLQRQLSGTFTTTMQLFIYSEGDGVQADWQDSEYVDRYAALSDVGYRKFKGPMLVPQGTDDSYVYYNITKATVEQVCADAETSGDLEFLVVDGVGHVPSLDATRPIWMRWIEDRFMGKNTTTNAKTSTPLGGECRRTELESWLPIDRYLAVGSSFPQWAAGTSYDYQVPLGP